MESTRCERFISCLFPGNPGGWLNILFGPTKRGNSLCTRARALAPSVLYYAIIDNSGAADKNAPVINSNQSRFAANFISRKTLNSPARAHESAATNYSRWELCAATIHIQSSVVSVWDLNDNVTVIVRANTAAPGIFTRTSYFRNDETDSALSTCYGAERTHYHW